MHSARSLASNKEPRQRLIPADDLAMLISQETTHTVVDHRGDDRDVKGLLPNPVRWEAIGVELFAAARRPTPRVPRLARRIRWKRAAIWILFHLLGCLEVLLV